MNDSHTRMKPKGNEMRKIVIREQNERYLSAILELVAIGDDEHHWIRAEEGSDRWYHNIVCAIRYNTITSPMFEELDERPHGWGDIHVHRNEWHRKLRKCRNHAEWGPKLYEALKINDEIVAKGASHE